VAVVENGLILATYDEASLLTRAMIIAPFLLAFI
jgi:hypothetical protein